MAGTLAIIATPDLTKNPILAYYALENRRGLTHSSANMTTAHSAIFCVLLISTSFMMKRGNVAKTKSTKAPNML
jgi:predicted solute-binding protein